jgi:hypothetical protein
MHRLRAEDIPALKELLVPRNYFKESAAPVALRTAAFDCLLATDELDAGARRFAHHEN